MSIQSTLLPACIFYFPPRRRRVRSSLVARNCRAAPISALTREKLCATRWKINRTHRSTLSRPRPQPFAYAKKRVIDDDEKRVSLVGNVNIVTAGRAYRILWFYLGYRSRKSEFYFLYILYIPLFLFSHRTQFYFEIRAERVILYFGRFVTIYLFLFLTTKAVFRH